MRYLAFLCTAMMILVLALEPVTGVHSEVETAREDIVANRRKRALQMEALLQDTQDLLKDESKTLDDTERSDLERKVELYTKKLEQLRQVPDDLEIERILQRERERDERVDARRKEQEAGRQDGSEL